MESVKVLAKGQIVIPARLRKKHHIRAGQEIRVFEYNGLIYLVPPSTDPVGEALGCLPKETFPFRGTTPGARPPKHFSNPKVTFLTQM